MVFGITENGVNIKTEDDIVESMGSRFVSLEGVEQSDVDDPRTIIGIINGGVSPELSTLWEFGGQIILNSSKDSASGVALTNLGAGNFNKPRLGNVRSKATATLGTTGTVDVFVEAGSIVKQSSNNIEWQTKTDVTIPGISPFTIDVDVESVNFGDFRASIGSINTTVSLISGFDTVTNAAIESIIGRVEETDPQYLLRLQQSLFIFESGILDAVISGLSANVPGIQSISGLQNRTDILDANGVNPRSIKLSIDGGGDQSIANQLGVSVADGIGTQGNTSAIFTDSSNNTTIFSWDRPTPVPIYYIVNIDINSNFDNTQNVKDALVNFGSDFQPDQDVINYKGKCALEDIAGIVGEIELLQGIAPTPTTEDLIVISSDEKATFSDTNIIVNTTVV